MKPLTAPLLSYPFTSSHTRHQLLECLQWPPDACSVKPYFFLEDNCMVSFLYIMADWVPTYRGIGKCRSIRTGNMFVGSVAIVLPFALLHEWHQYFQEVGRTSKIASVTPSSVIWLHHRQLFGYSITRTLYTYEEKGVGRKGVEEYRPTRKSSSSLPLIYYLTKK